MEKIKLIKSSLRNSLGTAVYVVIVVLIINNAEKILGTMKNIIGPIAFLLLFVASAAITGFLVLGQPMMLYFDFPIKKGEFGIIRLMSMLSSKVRPADKIALHQLN